MRVVVIAATDAAAIEADFSPDVSVYTAVTHSKEKLTENAVDNTTPRWSRYLHDDGKHVE